MLSKEEVKEIDNLLIHENELNRIEGFQRLVAKAKGIDLREYFPEWVDTYMFLANSVVARNIVPGLNPMINTRSLEIIRYLMKLQGRILIRDDASLQGKVLPDFRLPKIKFLIIERCDIVGELFDFQGMPMVQRIWIKDTKIKGSIPDFSNMPALKVLDLNDNKLSGQLPSFSKCKYLEAFYAESNKLSGQVPDFQLRQMTAISLMDNQLSGEIPDFSGMPFLWDLNLANNKLSGQLPSFKGLPRLKYLNVMSNDLTGIAFEPTSYWQQLELVSQLSGNNLVTQEDFDVFMSKLSLLI